MGKRRFLPAGTGKQAWITGSQGNWLATWSRKKRRRHEEKSTCVIHTELVREGSVLYEGKDGNTSITTTEEAAGFAASFFDEAESYGHCSGRI